MARWILDPDHSVADFAIRHMMLSNVLGHFSKVTGTFHFDPADVARSTVEAVVDVSSICTGIKKRDQHLLSPDFFDATNYPEIIFKSTKIEALGGNRCKVTGNLTIRGITHQVTLDGEYFGPVNSPFGVTSVGFSGMTKINREDYGVMWNEPMEGGGVVVGREVEITLNVEADLSTE